MKIGDTIYYQEKGGHPAFWYKAVILGETSRSWLVNASNEWWTDRPELIGHYAKKLPKSGTKFTTKEKAELQSWTMTQRYQIARTVERLNDGALLRQVADLIGYKDSE